MHNKARTLLSFLLTLLLLVSAIGTPASAAGEQLDEIVVIFGSASFTSLDPQTHAGTILGGVLSNMYETLLQRAPDGSFTPVLATEWTQIDPTCWEFSLREGVSFHNGEPFNADAVKFSVDRAMDPVINAKNSHNFSSIDRVEVVDELTVRVYTKVEDPLLVSRFAAWPMSIVPPVYTAEVGDDAFALAPVGTGPYTFVSYQADADLVFAANTEYWGGAPAIGNVRWRVVSEAGARMAELQAGTAHIVDNVPFDQVEMLDAQDGISILASMGIRTVYLQLDNEMAPTDDMSVRQAIAHSIDVDSIIDDLLVGYAKRIPTFAVPEVRYYNDSLTPYSYDVELARKLLLDAGYGDKLPLKMVFDISPGRVSMDREVCEVIAAMLTDTGLFEVEIVINELGAYNEKYNLKELPHTIGQIILSTHGNYTYDPDFTLTRSFLSIDEPRAIIDSHRKHPDWDEMILKASTSTSDEERQELYYALQELIYEDSARVYLYQQVVTWGVSDAIEWNPDGEMVYLPSITPTK